MLSFSMDLMYENYEMIYFSGRHAMERTAERIPVQHAKSRSEAPWYIEPSLQSGCDPLRGGCG